MMPTTLKRRRRFEIATPNFVGLTTPPVACSLLRKHVTDRGGPNVLLRRLAVRYAVAAPLFVFAAWLFVTGALGPSS
jgi:hypothetical protein